jgi:hypothetical protein
MPVPKRQKRSLGSLSLTKISSNALKLLDVSFLFEKTKTLLLWGFTPTVIWIGLRTEPRPAFFDLFNIWE